MKIIKIFLIAIVLIIAAFIIVYAYYGGFKKLEIKTSVQGGETIVYEEMFGDYSQSGIVMDKVYYSLLNDYKIETFKGFGIYYDNPQKVEKSKLRSEIGCIIENKDLEKIKNLPSNFKIKVLPEKEYITTAFPFKGKMSIMVSLMKVYPALGKFAQKQELKGGAVMEIYDMPNKKIYYRQEIIK